MLTTVQQSHAKCEKFHPGDEIRIVHHRKVGNGEITTKEDGKVINRNKYYLTVQRDNSYRECFTYTDIVLFGRVEKRTGRKRKNDL